MHPMRTCLKRLLISMVFLAPLIGDAQEILVNTQEDCFYFSIDGNTTVEELTQRVQNLSNSPACSVLIEIPMSEGKVAEPIWWRPKARRHGQYLGYARNYYDPLNVYEQNDIRFII